MCLLLSPLACLAAHDLLLGACCAVAQEGVYRAACCAAAAAVASSCAAVAGLLDSAGQVQTQTCSRKGERALFKSQTT